MYKNPDTFKKLREFPFRFYSQKSGHFMLRDFHEIFEIGIYIYKKHDTLRYVMFLYTKTLTLRKKKTICVTFFYIQKA